MYLIWLTIKPGVITRDIDGGVALDVGNECCWRGHWQGAGGGGGGGGWRGCSECTERVPVHYAAGINSDPLVSTTARRPHYIHPALNAEPWPRFRKNIHLIVTSREEVVSVESQSRAENAERWPGVRPGVKARAVWNGPGQLVMGPFGDGG